MDIRDFNPATDYQSLLQWMEAHRPGEPALLISELPANGWIAYEGDRPVATAFLRLVEGGYAQLDGFASNPEAPGATRHRALDQLTERCLERAKELNIRHVMAFTMDKSILVRSMRHGFVPTPHVVIAHNPRRT